MNRLPLAILVAGSTSAVVSAMDLRVGVAGGLVFGPIAVLARKGPLAGMLGACVGLLLAGLAQPLGLSPENWTLALVGLAMGGAWRKAPEGRLWVPWAATALVLIGICLLLGRQGLLWALPLAGGVAGAQWSPPVSEKLIGILFAIGVLSGSALTVNAGFVQVVNTTDRGLLVEWYGNSRLLPAHASGAWWTQGQSVVFRAVPGGATFVHLPTGGAKRSAPVTPADRSETGESVPCEELVPRALEGDERYQVALFTQGCEAPVRWLTPGAIAARVLAGDKEGALVPLSISGRDVILVLGGLFLLTKATLEIHHLMEGAQEPDARRRGTISVGAVLTQIVFLDLVFSLDSVITAVGMADRVEVMIAAVIIAVLVMIAFAVTVSQFIARHSSMKTLALAFLVMIGVLLVADGLGQHFPRGYVYFALAFSLLVELINLRAGSRRQSAEATG